jgi:signal transduction histidine kinase
MVVDLAQAPPPGGLREALAGTLGDPELQIAYPVGDGRHVDATGAPIEILGTPDRATTALVRDGATVALLGHRADLLGDPRLVEEVASAAGLAFEHERLEAEARAQLEELRTSRARIVAESDRERQRLERDLHDGAQQRIVGLALAMRLLRNGIDAAAVPSVASRVESAEAELYRAVDDLRELATGIHPAVLGDVGLAAAIEALGEHSTAPVRMVTVPDERFSSAVETAAYLVVAEAAKMGAVRVVITRLDGRLVVEVDAVQEPTGLVDLEDRVGSLDGTLSIEPTPVGVRIRAALPCG